MQIDNVAGCKLWKGAKNKAGYGYQFYKGKVAYAHRVAFEKNNGPLLEGQIVMHLCDNPSCINPKHLKAGTPKENTLDMVNKLRHRGASIFKCPRGHEYSLKNTWIYKGKRHCRTCNKERMTRWRHTKSA